MLKKKGFLISLMIIIGIMIVIIFFVAFAMREQLTDLIKPKTANVNEINIYVENCLDTVARYGVYKLGKQGGSLTLKPNHFKNPFLDVNYAFDNVKTFPELESIKTELESFVDNNLKNCTDDFAEFKAKGMDIRAGNVSTEIIFGSRSMIFNVKYPLEISYQEKTFSIEKFQSDVQIALRRIHSETDKFLDLEQYDMLYLNDLDADVYIFPSEDTDIFVTERMDSKISADNYLFIFTVR